MRVDFPDREDVTLAPDRRQLDVLPGDRAGPGRNLLDFAFRKRDLFGRILADLPVQLQPDRRARVRTAAPELPSVDIAARDDVQ